MILNGPVISLQAVLAGAVSANQPECHVAYVDYNKDGAAVAPAEQRTALNSTTDVTILSAPPFNPTREVISASIYNKDTASVTVTVKTDDGTTERIIAKATLLTLEVLCYEKGQGWYALDANGNRKEATSSVFSSLTVTGNATVGGTLSAGVTTLSGAQVPLILSGDTSAVWQRFAHTGSADDYLIGVSNVKGGFAVYNETDGRYELEFDGAGGVAIPGTLAVTGTIKSGGYTVGTLPSNSAGLVAYVTDQLTAAAAKGVAPTGGGSVTCYVMNTGAGWVGI